jgi:flagellin
MISLQTNVNSLVAQQNLSVNSAFQAKTIQRLTSGYRINSAGDDAAGLAVANKFRSDISELSQGVRNANDAVSQLQIMDGGLNNISQLLDRARTLATQSASSSFTADRTPLDGEFQNVLAEINRQAQSIGMTAGGDFAKSLGIFIGGGRTDGSASSQNSNGTVTVDLSSSLVDTSSLGLAANGVSGSNDLRSGTNKLSTAVPGSAGTAATLSFTVKGAAAVTVDFSTNFDTTHIKNENDVVTAVNKAIDQAGLTNTNFANANIRASISSDGKLTFTSSNAFSVIQTGAVASSLIGATSLQAAVSSVTIAGAAVTAGNEDLTFSYRDSTGAAVATTVTLPTATTTSAGDIRDAINNNTTLAGAGIFAALNAAGTSVVFMKADGGSFELAANLDATGAGGVAEGVQGSSTTALGSSSAVDIKSAGNALTTITALKTAVTNLSRIQATVGRAQNQLSYATNLAQSQISNFSSAQSQIRDADVAAEAANLSKAQTLSQASIAAMAQANSAPQAVLSLLRG